MDRIERRTRPSYQMRSAERRFLSSQQLRQDPLFAQCRESRRQQLRDRRQAQRPSKVGADDRKLEVFRSSLNASLEQVSLLRSQIFADCPAAHNSISSAANVSAWVAPVQFQLASHSPSFSAWRTDHRAVNRSAQPRIVTPLRFSGCTITGGSLRSWERPANRVIAADLSISLTRLRRESGMLLHGLALHNSPSGQ